MIKVSFLYWYTYYQVLKIYLYDVVWFLVSFLDDTTYSVYTQKRKSTHYQRYMRWIHKKKRKK